MKFVQICKLFEILEFIKLFFSIFAVHEAIQVLSVDRMGSSPALPFCLSKSLDRASVSSLLALWFLGQRVSGLSSLCLPVSLLVSHLALQADGMRLSRTTVMGVFGACRDKWHQGQELRNFVIAFASGDQWSLWIATRSICEAIH